MATARTRYEYARKREAKELQLLHESHYEVYRACSGRRGGASRRRRGGGPRDADVAAAQSRGRTRVDATPRSSQARKRSSASSSATRRGRAAASSGRSRTASASSRTKPVPRAERRLRRSAPALLDASRGRSIGPGFARRFKRTVDRPQLCSTLPKKRRQHCQRREHQP